MTLVEVLVTVAIVAVLIALLLPVVQSIREVARRTQCANKMKQVAMACINFASRDDHFPAAVVAAYRDSSQLSHFFNPAEGQPTNLRPWTVMILPFLENSPLYDRFDLTRPFSGRYNSPQSYNSDVTLNRAAQFVPNPAFLCPSDPYTRDTSLHSNYNAVMGGGPSEYEIKAQGKPRKWARAAGNSQWLGWFSGNFFEPMRLYENGMIYVNSQVTSGHVRDGLSNVFLIGESSYSSRTNPALPSDYAWAWSSGIWAPGNWGNGYDCCTTITTAVAAVESINGAKPGESLSPPGYGSISGSSTGVISSWQFGDSAQNQMRFGSYHLGGVNVVLADGSTHFLLDAMDLTVYQSLGDRKDGGTSGSLAP